MGTDHATSGAGGGSWPYFAGPADDGRSAGASSARRLSCSRRWGARSSRAAGRLASARSREARLGSPRRPRQRSRLACLGREPPSSRRSSGDVHEFTLPRRRQTRRRDVRLHRGKVPATDRIVLSGLPVTRAARTIADLLAGHVEPGVVGGIAAEVLDGGLEDSAEVTERIAPYATRFDLPRGDGQATLDHLLAFAGSRGPADTAASAR